MDRGFLARGTDADLVTNTMLIQKLHSVVEARKVSHEASEPHAVNCVWENLNANGLGRALLKGSVGSAAQTRRGERMMAEKSSKCLHQSSERGEVATVRVTGTFLGHTDANNECVFPSPTSVPRNGGKLALKPMWATGRSTSQSLPSEERM